MFNVLELLIDVDIAETQKLKNVHLVDALLISFECAMKIPIFRSTCYFERFRLC